MLTFSGWIRRNTFWDLMYLLIFTSLWSWVITAFFINCQMFHSCVLLFQCFSTTECVLTELYSLRKLWSGIFDLNMHWFKPDCVSRDSDKHYSTICARTDCCLAHLHCYLLITDSLPSGNYHYKCDFASEEKKTASQSNEHKMSDSRSLLIWIIDNVSPILPSSVLECCLEFLHFWEHTHLQRNLLPTYD